MLINNVSGFFNDISNIRIHLEPVLIIYASRCWDELSIKLRVFNELKVNYRYIKLSVLRLCVTILP